MKNKNQLFSKIPPYNLVNDIFKLFIKNGISNLPKQITQNQISKKKIDEFSKMYIKKLNLYYYKCKEKIYLANITFKKFITILRQISRPYKISIKSTEKYSSGKKYLVYLIIQDDNSKIYDLTIKFD